MNIELACPKFITSKTVLDCFNEIIDYGGDTNEFMAEYDSSNVDTTRKVVIAAHNSITYQVDGMTADYTPDSYRFTSNDGKEMSMTEYFFKAYGIKLRHKE